MERVCLMRYECAMKSITLTAALFLLIAVSEGCQDSRVTPLEQRVNRLEQTVRQLEAEQVKTSNDEAARRAKLENCVVGANMVFDSSIISNGTRSRNGSYSVPVPVEAEMLRQKQAKIEECKLLYSN
jgi:hypothetical protein